MVIFADLSSLWLSGVIHCKHADNQCLLISTVTCKIQEFVSIFHITCPLAYKSDFSYINDLRDNTVGKIAIHVIPNVL